MNSQPLQRYRAALLSLPAPGDGCHTALLGAANHGVMAGLDDGQIFADLAGCISAGTRRIAPREIEDAIRRARHDYVASGAGRSTPPRGPVAAAHPTFDGAAAVAALVRAGGANLDPINDILRQSAGQSRPGRLAPGV